MPNYYNLTNLTSANNIFEIYQALNTLSGGLLTGMILVVIWIVVFIIGKAFGNDTKVVIVAGSFITSIVAVLFWATGVIGLNIVFYPLLLLFFSLLALIFMG